MTIVGYSLFVVFFISTVIALLVDMYLKNKEYDALIHDDKNMLRSLGFNFDAEDVVEALRLRIAKIKAETSNDD